LSLAATLGHRLREAREQHGEPQPKRDREDEAWGGLTSSGEQGVNEEQRGERAADLDHEHDRVTDHLARVELDERIDERAAHDRALEQRTSLRCAGHHELRFSDRCRE
jgi:hypothetical protein